MSEENTLTYGFWTYLDRSGRVRQTVTLNRGNVARSERAMFVQITVPKAIFEEPELRASITVENSPDGIGKAVDVTSSVQDALEGIPDVTVEVLTRLERVESKQ